MTVNVWDIVLIAVLLAAVALAVLRVVRVRRGSGCGCGCDGCTRGCRKQEEKEQR